VVQVVEAVVRLPPAQQIKRAVVPAQGETFLNKLLLLVRQRLPTQ
jgi:hypothetical protein